MWACVSDHTVYHGAGCFGYRFFRLQFLHGRNYGLVKTPLCFVPQDLESVYVG